MESKDLKYQHCGAIVGIVRPMVLGEGTLDADPEHFENYASRAMTLRYATGITGKIDVHLCTACNALPALDLDRIARTIEADWIGEASTQAVIDATKKGFPITLEDREEKRP